MCQSLKACSVEPTIVTTDADGSGSLRVKRDELVDHEGVPTRFFVRQWSEAFKYSRPLSTWLKRHMSEFDVVHVHAVFSHSSLAAAAAARRAGVPYIVRPLGSLSPWALRQRRVLKQLLWRAGVKRMLTAAAAIHCTSRSEQDHVARVVARSGVVIPLGADVPPGGAKVNAAFGGFADPVTGDDPYILVLGRLHPVKGLDLLVPAFLELARERFQNWRLILAGDGDARYVAKLEGRFGSHPAWDRIGFTGWIDGDRKTQLLRRASLLAMPSYQENFGLAAFEALAQGVPVLVSSSVDAAADIRDAGAGWVADLTCESLKDSLAEALADADGRAVRGARGRALVADRYSWNTVAERLKLLYEQVCRARERT
jgi:glycosyltransferase involved in cell wall biosynthesis